MSRRTDILDELLRILGLMLVLVGEVRRIDHETTKTAQDVSQHLNQ